MSDIRSMLNGMHMSQAEHLPIVARFCDARRSGLPIPSTERCPPRWLLM